MSRSPIRAVLWDADGVLQSTPPGAWDQAVAVVSQFPDALVGGSVTEPAVAAASERLGLSVADVLSVWSRFDVLAESLDVVEAVRSAGVPCYLTTNQDALRAVRMRALAPYEERLDGSFYSCDLGVAKPSTAYFERVLADLALDPSEALFIDDSEANVTGARAAGLAAEVWRHDQGIDGLWSLLRRHGVEPPGR